MQSVPRLYKSFQPDHYQLELTLLRKKRVFHGVVTITGELLLSDTSLFLHAKDLQIKNAKVNGNVVQSHIQDDTVELVPHVENPFVAGTQKIEIVFEGTITDAMHGLYPCYYEHNGDKKELLATQFESHHAREVFPCVDEPEAKATFDLTLCTENDITVLGNMPISEQTTTSDQLKTRFETSPRMSPYLLAFVAGELQSKSAKTTNGTTVTIYATAAQSADSLDFGLVTAVKCIEFFNDYFGIPYPLPKCDHVALPDFSSGAMENWGLITYREICLLADESTAISSKESIATIIAHETSHQWFGNLVTMQWWDDLWLNESFASFMEYMAVDAIYPKWNIWMTFATQETLSALRRDYLPGVQAVKTAVNHPDEIGSLFDPAIVYAKGARLLKMLHDFIGSEAFQKGLTQYFKDNAYQNTVGDDLWKAFSSITGQDIGSFMRVWVEQPGMPVVSLKVDQDSYSLTQNRFLIGASDESDPLWPIPLGATNNSFPQLFDTRQISIQLQTIDLLYLNKGNSAHFVTAYEQTLFEKISQAIAKDIIHPVDRLALLHETSLLSKSGFLSATVLFNLLTAYKNEREEPVWDIISMVIGDLKRFVQEDDHTESVFKTHISALALPLYEDLGWDKKTGENENDTKLRSTILGLLTYSEYRPAVDRGMDIFTNATKLEEINSEIRPVVFSIAAKFGSMDDRKQLLELYRHSSVAEIQQDALVGLTSTKDPETIHTLIDTIRDDSVVRAQDIDRWFVFLIRNRHAREATWKWMVAHWGWITEKFAGDKTYDSFPRYAASALYTREWLDTYTSFFDPLKSQPALTRAIDLGIKDIEGRVAWIEKDYPELKEALSRNLHDVI